MDDDKDRLIVTDGMVFCRACGASMHSTAPLCPQCGAPQAAVAGGGDGIPRTFGNSIAICFRKFAVTSGRAPRAEYWWFSLFSLLSQSAIGLVFVLAPQPGVEIVSTLVSIAFFVPSFSVGIRRLHDIGRSGWWWLIWFIPLVGSIVGLVWLCTRGTRGDNRFGPENGAA